MPPRRRKSAAKAAKAAKVRDQKTTAMAPRARKGAAASTDYEMKFASLEVVLAVSDPEASEDKDKFMVGRLREDVLLGMDPETEISVLWFDYDEDSKTYVAEQLDTVVSGSLVCSITEHTVEGVDDDGNETIKVATDAFVYGNRKLDEQLDDDYNSGDDSQFGDLAVMKRINKQKKSGGKAKVKKEEEDFDDMDDEDDSGKKKKKRKARAAPTKGKNKPAKGLTPRPDVKMAEDYFLKSTGKISDFHGDLQRATREVVRAVRAGDKKALRAAAKATHKIPTLHYPQCYALGMIPLMWAIVQGDKTAMKVILDDHKANIERPAMQPCALPELTTGKQTSRFANYNRRAINASRGGREGNNALLHDCAGNNYIRPDMGVNSDMNIDGSLLPTEIGHSAELPRMNIIRDFDEISDGILDVAEASYSRRPFGDYVIEDMVRAGHHNMIRRVIADDVNSAFSSGGYNIFHLESLSNEAPKDPKKPFSKDILARSVAKKSETDTRFSPLACACINPNPVFLEALLTAAPEHATLVDQRETSLLHYAAACKSDAPLKYLIEKFSLPRSAVDKDKNSPLHYAARAARTDNIVALLDGVDDDQLSAMLNAKNVDGYSAVHCAAQSQREGHVGAVKVLLEAGVNANVPSTASRNKVSLVHIACRLGDLALLDLLLLHGGDARKGDKLKRTPLIHACMNGHAHIVSRLLEYGVDVEAADTSDNRALHYAAAYGWGEECVDQLLAVGADPDPENSWKTTPLSVAIEKGRNHISQELLKLPGVNVNNKDDKGKTLFRKLVEGFVAKSLMLDGPASMGATATAAATIAPAADGGEKKKGDAGSKRKRKSAGGDSTKEKDKLDDDEKARTALIAEMSWPLRALLDRDDVDIATSGADGIGVLHVLCMQAYPRSGDGEERAAVLAEMLLSRGGIDIDSKDSDGMTPILHAAISLNKLLFRFLIERGAAIDASLVDADEKNLAHHLIGGHEPCEEQLALVREKVSNDAFEELLASHDKNGRTPLHLAMKTASTTANQSIFERVSSLLKEILTAFPSLSFVQVRPNKIFGDASLLASVILGSDEGGDIHNGHHRFRGNFNHNSDGRNSATILSDAERIAPQSIKNALERPLSVVPVEPECIGENLVHCICLSQYPSRVSATLDWLLPLCKTTSSASYGRAGLIMTPLQILLRRQLFASLSAERASSLDERDHERLLMKLLSAAAKIQDSTKEEINDPPVDARSGLPAFDGEGQSDGDLDARDKRSVDEIKHVATKFAGDKNREDGKRLVELFSELMLQREARLCSSRKDSIDDAPLAIHLASKGGNGAVPLVVWEELVKVFGLDLERVCEKSGDSVLHVAMRKKDKDLCRFVSSRCKQLVTKPNLAGRRPVHEAAILDDPVFVNFVLENVDGSKAESNHTDKLGRTAFHYSVSKASVRQEEALEPCELIFLRAGARLDATDTKGRTPLHYCFIRPEDDHFNFPHSCVTGESHDRVELCGALLNAEGAKESLPLADNQGRTALFYAAAYNSTVCSLLLVGKLDRSALFVTDGDDNTPLNVSILRGNENYTITLLKSVSSSGDVPRLVDVNDVRRTKTKGEDGNWQIRISSKAKKTIVWHAIKENMRGLVYILLNQFHFPPFQASIDALGLQNYTLFRKLITTSPLQIVQQVDDRSNRNLLHEVANVSRYTKAEWSTTLASQLLKSDILPSSVDSDGRTPLHLAAARGHVDLAKLLASADPDTLRMKDNKGHLPLGAFMRSLPSLSILQEKDCFVMFELLSAGMDSLDSPQVNVVKVMVQKSEKDTDKTAYDGIEFKPGPNMETVAADMVRSFEKKNAAQETEDVESLSTIVLQAIKAERFKLVQKLLSMGALVNATGGDGLAPLHAAALSGSISTVSLLLRNGSDPNVATNDDRSLTPLLIVAMKTASASRKQGEDMLEVAHLLLRYGANPLAACGLTKSTPLHFACCNNSPELASLLLRSASRRIRKVKPPKVDVKQYKTPNAKKFLVAFGDDLVGLYPAVLDAAGSTVQVSDPVVSSVPIGLVSEMFPCDDLALDSSSAMRELAVESGFSADANAVPQRNSELFGPDGDDDDSNSEEEDDGDDSDDDAEEPASPWNPTRSRPTPADGTASQMMSKFFGLEGHFVGCDDANLTKPFAAGDSVLVQELKGKGSKYTDSFNQWKRGVVAAVHANETYDVGVDCGPIYERVLRLRLRPWRGSTGEEKDDAVQVLSGMIGAQDKEGRTPLQAAVKPMSYGSFENLDMVELLVEYGSTVDQDTVHMARKGSKLRQFLSEQCCEDEPTDMDVDEPASQDYKFPVLQPIAQAEFDADIVAAWRKQEEDGELQRKDKPPKVNSQLQRASLRVLQVADPPDSGDGGGGEAVVHHFFDAVMVKVEVNHISYSENKYYKLQLVEDTDKGLYILVTNWGYIGDHGGQKQETPFGTKEEAIAEFSKVFKSKSGNAWTDFIRGNFTPMLKKYKPVRILSDGYEKTQLPSLSAIVDDPLKHPNVDRSSTLPSHVEAMVRAMTDAESIAVAAANIGLRQSKLPLGRLSIDAILAAEKKLGEVEAALAVVDKLVKEEQLMERREALQDVAILTSQYFEIMPTAEGDEAIRPFEKDKLIEQKRQLLGLRDLSVASQIVTVANMKASPSMNPLQYAYRALNARVGKVPEGSPERISIEQYFRNTSDGLGLVISEVLALDRCSEKSNAHLSNRRLLWHGTPNANVAGVIKEGLRVAPASAQISGAAFGEGVYFADMASKSWSYCRADWSSATASSKMPRAYLMLADVALGEQEKVSTAFDEDDDGERKGDSVWAVGYEGPDADKDVTLESGVVVPLGKVVRTPSFDRRGVWSIDWEQIKSKTSARIEEVRNSPDTTFPVTIPSVKMNMYGREGEFDIVLEHGPFCNTARAVPVKKKKRKAKKKRAGDKKRRKTERGAKAEADGGDEEADGESDDEDEDSIDPMFHREHRLQRKEDRLDAHVHHNEFIVPDTSRINIRYIVEVTSRSWLEEQERKKRKQRPQHK